jgi:hypothetical protein
MKKWLLLIFAVAALGLIVGVASASEDEPMPTPAAGEPALLFVLTGQSNAAQQATASQIGGQDVTVDGSWYYAPQHTRLKRLVPLQPYRGNFGVEVSFAQEVARATGQEVIVAKVYRGGTSIIAWEPSAPNPAWERDMKQVGNPPANPMYPRVLAVKREAEAAYRAQTGRDVVLAGVLYIQVERDSKSSYGAVRYEANLKALIAALRKDWNAPDLPFVFIDSHTNLTGSADVVHQAVVNVARDVDYTAWVPVRDLPKKQPAHFSTEGVWKLGERLAEAWLDLR